MYRSAVEEVMEKTCPVCGSDKLLVRVGDLTPFVAVYDAGTGCRVVHGGVEAPLDVTCRSCLSRFSALLILEDACNPDLNGKWIGPYYVREGKRAKKRTN